MKRRFIILSVFISIIVLGVFFYFFIFCVHEGEMSMTFHWPYRCCFGLEPISCAFFKDSKCLIPNCFCEVCAKCGNGTCGLGENKCNCPQDCK